MGDLLVEVRPNFETGGDLAPSLLTEKLASRLDEVGDAILKIADKLKKRLDEEPNEVGTGWQLDTVDVTMSLDLEAESGVIVSRVAASAGFEVSLTWSRAGE